jgi:cell wall-associated NlpC family hydrolase
MAATLNMGNAHCLVTKPHTSVTAAAAYRTASGDTAPVHGLGAGDSSNAQQQLGPARPAPAAAAAAGYHVALSEIQPGDLLTTNYLGLGHKRLMSTPARQQLLQCKFLFKCTCDR